MCVCVYPRRPSHELAPTLGQAFQWGCEDRNPPVDKDKTPTRHTVVWFRNPANQLRLVVYPIIYWVLFPSQVVVWDFWTTHFEVHWTAWASATDFKSNSGKQLQTAVENVCELLEKKQLAITSNSITPNIFSVQEGEIEELSLKLDIPRTLDELWSASLIQVCGNDLESFGIHLGSPSFSISLSLDMGVPP